MYDPYFSYASESLLYIAVLIVAVIGMIASLKVQSTFKKYSTMPARCGLRRTALRAGCFTRAAAPPRFRPCLVRLPTIDPTKNAVGLSESVYNSTSVAALAVAAHEIGHVMQHQEGYTPIKVRNALLPVARMGSTAWAVACYNRHNDGRVQFGKHRRGAVFWHIGISACHAAGGVQCLPPRAEDAYRGRLHILWQRRTGRKKGAARRRNDICCCSAEHIPHLPAPGDDGKQE